MRVSFLGEKMSWLKGFFLFYLFFLVIFFAAAPFLTLWLYSETSVTRTLLPQLIGFCMQGGFLVVLFALYEKRSTVDTRRSWKFTLRSFLAPLVDECLAEWHDSDNQGAGLLPSPSIVQIGIDAIRTQPVPPERIALWQRIAHDRLLAMQSLSVVAAQIDHAHLESWMTLLRLLRAIEQESDGIAVGERVEAFLLEVVKFDELYFM
ncbi:MAG: hypothetical protein HQM00_08370 [Magnetococcales bacterium]|nr:hypothetical protein [Magnetococcales bacterium]